jgi:hypothetical protein
LKLLKVRSEFGITSLELTTVRHWNGDMASEARTLVSLTGGAGAWAT